MRLIIGLVLCLVFTAKCFASEAIAGKPNPECGGIKARNTAPRYPFEALRDKKGGTVIVAAWLDKCGRPVKTEVLKSSGNKLLNVAALEAANKSVFYPSSDAGEALSRIEVPYTFTPDTKEYRSEKVSWPASHKRAYFVLDEMPMPHETVEQAKAEVYLQPYRLLGLRPTQIMLQLKNEGGDIWLFLADNVSHVSKIAARYQRIPAERPTISVQVLCEPAIKDCDEMKTLLLKSGLRPFAESLNPQ